MGVSGKPKAARSEKTFVFRFLAGIVLPFMYLVGRYRIQQGENLPLTGPVVVAPNHYSEIDPLVVGLAIWKLGRSPRYLGKASLFSVPVLGWFLRKSGQIPVERAGSRSHSALAAAKQLADNNLVVVVYPEGTLTRDPDLWPMRGKTGAVRLALTAGVPLVPVAQWGAQQILPRYGKRFSFFPRKNVDIRFGEPVDLSRFQNRPLNSTTLADATEVLMAAMTGLLADLRGEPAPTERWDPAKRGQPEIGRFEETA